MSVIFIVGVLYLIGALVALLMGDVCLAASLVVFAIAFISIEKGRVSQIGRFKE